MKEYERPYTPAHNASLQNPRMKMGTAFNASLRLWMLIVASYQVDI